MDFNIVIRTTVPILLLIGLGFFSRRMKILKSGDERVLSAYVYYFALPALFFINMGEMNFNEEALRFMFAGIIPIFVVLAVYLFLYLIIRYPKKTLYLLILSTVFGSLSFFGIPFITFAFQDLGGERLAALSSASISPVSVAISITILELYKLEDSSIWTGLTSVLKKLSRNPLIISILSGILLSVIRISIPYPISTLFHMLGGTTSTVAIFMLGVFLYGREYSRIAGAFKLSLLRIIFLPLVAFIITRLFGLPSVERSTLVLMHSMPTAISMMVLSQRYNFYQKTFASLILISSLGAGLYLNLWLFLLSLIGNI